MEGLLLLIVHRANPFVHVWVSTVEGSGNAHNARIESYTLTTWTILPATCKDRMQGLL